MTETVLNCLDQAARFLESAGVPEATTSAEALLSHVLGRSPLALHLESGLQVEEETKRQFQTLLAKRASRYPLQYLIRTVAFRGVVLQVGPGCLIPRPETEFLVERLLGAAAQASEPIKVLDIGTGSGNIAISLAEERPSWRVTGTDLSEEALEFARRNAVQNGVQERINFVQADLWGEIEEKSFDILVSNPPYLTRSDFRALQPEIAFEPRLALDGGEDGLSFYRRMIRDAHRVLKPEGLICFEVGIHQASSVAQMLNEAGAQAIQIFKDDTGIDRVLLARWMSHG